MQQIPVKSENSTSLNTLMTRKIAFNISLEFFQAAPATFFCPRNTIVNSSTIISVGSLVMIGGDLRGRLFHRGNQTIGYLPLFQT